MNKSTAGGITSRIVIIFLLFLMALVVCMLSQRNYLIKNGVPYTDSSVFEYMGRIIANGGVPYRDAFDHKGLLLYFINYLGILIAPHRGIWIIELCFMFVSSLGIYKLANLFAGKIQSLLTVMLVLAPLTIYFEGGNLTEEYALPLQIWALYIYIDFLLNNRISEIRVVICGVLLGCVLFIRPNMIPGWIVFSLYILVSCLVNRKCKELFRFIWQFLLGIVIVAAPLLIYLVVNNAIPEFLFDYLKFNMMYSKTTSDIRFRAFMQYINTPVIWIAFVVTVYKIIKDEDKKRKYFDITYLVYMVITMMLLSMSGGICGHYGMILLPMLIYPYALLFSKLSKESITKLGAGPIAVAYIIVAIIAPNWTSLLTNYSNYITAHRGDQSLWQSPEYDGMIQYIRENTGDNEKISVYGNEDAIYNLSGTFSSSVYDFQPGMLLDCYFADLEENNPKIVVIKSEPEDRMASFLDSHGYQDVIQYGDYHLFQQVYKP